ncbi:EAL domain-containing protein [Paraburkholderia sp. C35]|uniref:EAL and HDOD domain-containing protein n=1 Tax=Paraburkholderia sp. C35 TaxID=2126993 RepID=UPI000D685ADF|nr:EAL domain-containing protein [Paraburkholderia sp. C35]
MDLRAKEREPMVKDIVHTPEPDILLARQPIMNRDGERIGHELLFRPAPVAGGAAGDRGFMWTASVVQRTLGAIGLDNVLEGLDGYLNCTASFLDSDLIEILPATQIVLELSADTPLTEALRSRCDTLRQRGFHIALTELHVTPSSVDGFLPHVDIVKLDWRALTSGERGKFVAGFRRAGKIVVAEKIETVDSFNEAHTAGCHLFQGFYFLRPEPMLGRQLCAPTAVIIRLLDLAMRDSRIDEIEQELRASPALTVQILRLANAAAHQPRARRDGIASIRHALALVGLKQLTRWCCLLLYGGATLASMESDPLIQMVLARARFAETLAQEIDPGDREFQQHAYLTALLSLVHVPHGVEARDFIDQLPLNANMRAAILDCGGRLGALLCVAQSLESAQTGPGGWLAEIGERLGCTLDWPSLQSMFYRAQA